MSALNLTEVVFDEAIYPRSEWSQNTVDRYAEALAAGETFPAIVLERGTNRLLDGMHRARAHRQAEIEKIAVEFHDIPTGVPPKLYAASLSTRHGDRIAREDLSAIAREIASANPDYSLETIARYCGVTRQTVSKWVGDIAERRRLVRKVRALLLTRAGLSTREAATHLDVEHTTVVRDVRDDISHQLAEDVLQEALVGLPPECLAAAEAIRQERIFATWSGEERDLLAKLRTGYGLTVVVSLRGQHDNLIRWAESAGRYQRVDRKTEWGNPFEMPGDGDRATVIRNYAVHFIANKPSLLAKVNGLRGKVLGCWCAPEWCHAHVIRALAESNGDQALSLEDGLAQMLDDAATSSPEEFAALITGDYPHLGEDGEPL